MKNKSDELNIEETFHFSQIATAELTEQYTDYSFDNDCEGFRCQAINEDVNILQQASKAKSEMMHIYNMKDWQIQIKKANHNVEVVILYAGIIKNTKIIKNEMKRLGFSPSISRWTRRGFMLWRAIKFEPYKQEDLTKEAKRMGVLYHIKPLFLC